ncbi:hypothetical protein BJ741DRAFT_625252 [Chytriomyces cf. hyalinus JEL632]|nr:hypothetical protein BJ741DRAFT_625252 [Chytriomyces cf. hyalinus JEL632]
MQILLSLALLAITANAVCTKITVRLEWGQLSAADKNAYIAAVKKITARPMSNQYKDPTKMSTDDFSTTHAANAHWAHANAEFLVFHCAMLRLYEKALESAGWTGGLIYLDEGAVPTTWNKLDLFSKDYFGSLTRTQQCLTDGQFSKASGFIDLGDNGRSCVTRCGSRTMWSAKYIAANVLSTATTYEQLRGDDTANYHGTGHMVMGSNCDMGNPLWSPRDPLFYLHHTYVDKIYWKWQQLCPTYVSDYEGNLSTGKNPNPLLGNSRPVSPTLPLDSWIGLTAADVFDTKNDFLCYTYSKSAGDIDYTAAKCPKGQTANTNPWATNTTKTRRQDETRLAKRAATKLPSGTVTVAEGINGTSQVQVTCASKTSNYIMPAGCVIHKSFCSHISVKPANSEVAKKDSHCPMVIRPACEKETDYVRADGLKAPEPTSVYQYPTFLTDKQIRVRNMDRCGVRASDVNVMRLVDELNAGLRV